MKKVKVEAYENPNYSTLKMITGKILPAGLVVTAMITSMPMTNAQANETANTDYNVNETKNFPPMGGGAAPYPRLDITEEEPVTVIINQVIIEFDVAPVLESGKVFVPLRKVCETLGAYVTWDDETKTATAVKGDDTLMITLQETKMIKNGEEIALDAAVKIVDGRLLVPIRAIAEGLNCNVLWDETDNQVIIEPKEDQDIVMTLGAAPILQN